MDYFAIILFLAGLFVGIGLTIFVQMILFMAFTI